MQVLPPMQHRSLAATTETQTMFGGALAHRPLVPGRRPVGGAMSGWRPAGRTVVVSQSTAAEPLEVERSGTQGRRPLGHTDKQWIGGWLMGANGKRTPGGAVPRPSAPNRRTSGDSTAQTGPRPHERVPPREHGPRTCDSTAPAQALGTGRGWSRQSTVCPARARRAARPRELPWAVSCPPSPPSPIT